MIWACSREPERPQGGAPPQEFQVAPLPQAATDTGDDLLLVHLQRRERDRLPVAPRVSFDMAETGLPAALPGAATPTATRDALVWRLRDRELRTWWLRCPASQACQKLAERGGLWAAAASEVVEWRVERRMVRVCDMADCADELGSCSPGAAEGGPLAGRLDEVFWVGLATGKRTRLGPRLPDRVAIDLGSPGLHHFVEPLASTGSGLLVRTVTETMACGAMKGGTASELGWVRPGASVLAAPWSSVDEAALLPACRDALADRADQQKSLPFEHLAAIYLDLDDAGRWTVVQEWQAEPLGSQRPDEAARTRLPGRSLSAPGTDPTPDAQPIESAQQFGLVAFQDPPVVPPLLTTWPKLGPAVPGDGEHRAGWTWLPPYTNAAEMLEKFRTLPEPRPEHRSTSTFAAHPNR